MKIRLIAIQPTSESYLKEGIEEYKKRLQRYISFDYVEITTPKKWKSLPPEQLKVEESKLIASQIMSAELLFLLDENGKSYTSRQFSDFLQKQMNTGVKSIALVIGGAYGFSDELYRSAAGKVSLSKMTFSHQMVRLFAVEQIYRAMTILNNDPYHHD